MKIVNKIKRLNFQLKHEYDETQDKVITLEIDEQNREIIWSENMPRSIFMQVE